MIGITEMLIVGIISAPYMVLYLIVLIKIFQKSSALYGVLGLVIPLFAFIYGWIEATKLGIKKLMIVWTVLIIVFPLLLIAGPIVSNIFIKHSIRSANVGLSDQKFESRKKEPLAMFTLEEMKLKTSDKDEAHYVRLFASFGYDEKNIQLNAELSEKRNQITEIVSKILTNKSKEELEDEGKREELKEELREDVNSILQNGEIEDVYFTGFMVT